jgi:hypothetical protein
VNGEAWKRYTQALVGINSATRAVADLDGMRARERAEQEAALDLGGQWLATQRQRLDTLAAQLSATPAAAAVTERSVGVLSWEDGLADLALHLEAADRAGDDASVAGHRPQLLPQWTGTRARNIAVYLALCLPNAVFSSSVSLVGAEPSSGRFLWFLVTFPIIAVTAGAILIGRVCAPRLHDSDPIVQHTQRQERRRRSVLLGLLIAWASWIVPGQAFELLHALVTG